MKKMKEKGEMDYDDEYDILSFKTSEGEYYKSVELDHMTVDVDKEGHIIGIQLFKASAFLEVDKDVLRNLLHWELHVKIENGIIEIRIAFSFKQKDKLIEKNPIIMQNLPSALPDSEVACAA